MPGINPSSHGPLPQAATHGTFGELRKRAEPTISKPVPRLVEMPNYRFKAHDRGAGAEKSGAAVLADDDEALAFAKRVIRELMRQDTKRYTTSWTMEITAGTRSIASVPFESDATEDGADAS
jgi:hypothetical protein